MSGDKVVDLFRDIRRSVDASSGGGDDGGMEARLRTVEQAVVEIKAILPSLATKADLHDGLHTMTWRVIGWTTGVGAALAAAVFFIARHVR